MSGQRNVDLWIAITVTVTALIWMWLMRYTPINVFDEAILLVYPEQILKGRIPNRDFFSFYPPGNLWVLAFLYKIFGISFMTERVLGAIYRIVLMLAIYFLSLPRGRIAAATGALLSAWAGTFVGLVAFNWTGAMALCLVSLSALSVPVLKRQSGFNMVALAGWLAGLTVNVRVDTPALAVLLAAGPLLMRLSGKQKLCYAGGWAVGIAPFFLHVVHAGASNVVNNLFIQPIFRVGPARRLPLFSADSSAAALMVVLACSLAVTVAGGLRILKYRLPQDWVYFSLAVFCVCLVPQIWQRADTAHVMAVGQVVFGFAPMAGSFLLDPARAVGRSPAFIQAICSSVLVYSLIFARQMFPPQLPNDLHAFDAAPATDAALLRHGGRTIPMSTTAEAQLVRSMLEFVDSITKDGDRIFVGPGDLRLGVLNDVYLYYLLPRLSPASYYLEVNPDSSNASDSPLPKDLETADVLILNDARNLSLENNASAKPGDERAAEVVETRFIRRATFGTFAVYQRKASAP